MPNHEHKMTRRSKRKESEPGANGAAAADAAVPAPKKAKAKAKETENENEKEEKKGYTGGNQNDQHDWGPVDSNLLWRLVMLVWGTAMPQSYGELLESPELARGQLEAISKVENEKKPAGWLKKGSWVCAQKFEQRRSWLRSTFACWHLFVRFCV